LLGRPWPLPGEPLFLREDTNLAIALEEQEAAEEADRCPRCGMSKAECRKKANEWQFQGEFEQCHAIAAIVRAQKKFGAGAGSDELVWSAYLRH